MFTTQKKYWQRRGKNYVNEKFDTKFQEYEQNKFIDYLKNIEFNSVLEFGCGFGRLTKLVQENFDIKDYVAIDVSMDQINHASKRVSNVTFFRSMILDFSVERQFDLVFGTKVLMHVPKKFIRPTIKKLISFSKKHIINLDYQPNGRLARHCFNHNYKEIYANQGLHVESIPVRRPFSLDETGLIFHAQLRKLEIER